MTERRAIDAWFIAEILPHAPLFRGYARRLCASAEEAEDLVQEAYARTFALDDFRAVQSGKAFVLRVIHNLAVSKARRSKIVAIDHIPDVEALKARDPSPDSLERAVARQELALLEAAIRALPQQCRRVVTLRKIYELLPNQIAEELGLSVSTVEKHLTKGMRLLAQALNDTPSPSQTKPLSWMTRKTDERK